MKKLIALGLLLVCICTAFVVITLNKQDLPPHEHSFKTIKSVEPTCTEKGLFVTECSCGASYTKVIKALGHGDIKELCAIAPTCGDEGLMTYSCSVCGEVMSTKTLEATGEHYIKTVYVPGTCVLEGEEIDRCFVCHQEFRIEATPVEINRHDNTRTEIITDSTCSQKGLSRTYCEDCGLMVIEKEIPTKAHNYEHSVEEKATCQNTGKTYKVCKDCGYVNVIREYPVTNHAFKDVKVNDATCTMEACYELTCQYCGVVEYLKLPKLEHTYVDVSYEAPNGDFKGKQTCRCSVCGEITSVDLQPFDFKITKRSFNKNMSTIDIWANISGGSTIIQKATMRVSFTTNTGSYSADIVGTYNGSFELKSSFYDSGFTWDSLDQINDLKIEFKFNCGYGFVWKDDQITIISK